MAALVDRQIDINNNIKKILSNFKKDSSLRKTPEYIRIRIETLDNLWEEFSHNHDMITQVQEQAQQYFTDKVYQDTKDVYQTARALLSSFGKEEKAVQPSGEIDALLSLQRTYFRALDRIIQNTNLEQITEKWLIEDKIQSIKAKWNTIEDLHIKIDNILVGGDIAYEEEFCNYEKIYEEIKICLNTKLSTTEHIQKSTPQLDVPYFHGGYINWPSFFDLFTETIHNNKSIAKAQKLQHLKSKLKGEPHRLISHLSITAENYDTAWEILIHRYNNRQALFEQQIEIFLNQPSIVKQTSNDLKRLYDTTTECIHAIQNQKVDTISWDPFLVHILCKKLDQQTYTEYKASRKSPRDLASIEEFMLFLENKFTSLESISNKKYKNYSTPVNESYNKRPSYYQNNKFNQFTRFNNKTTQPGPHQNKPYQSTPYNQEHKNYQALATYAAVCPLCNYRHDLFLCKRFINMTPDIQLKTIARLRICKNCLYKHYDKECISTKRCKDCQGDHNTILHQAFTNSSPMDTNAVVTSYQSNKPINNKAESSRVRSTSQTRNAYHVSAEEEESLLGTALVNIQSADGTFVTFRALLDPASQVSLISERVVQILGLRRQRPMLSLSGIDLCTKQSRGMVNIKCQSIYDADYQFEAEAYIVSKVVKDLPSMSFQQRPWKHIENLLLADPDFNISRQIDILFNVDVYTKIIKGGLIKGPEKAPIAQQTSLGWVVSGTIKTLHCHAVLGEIVDLSKFWEIEDINNQEASISDEDSYCEKFFQETTRRLSNGKYEVALPMKTGYQDQLGLSKDKAVAQFKQLERKFKKNTIFAERYKQFMTEYHNLGHMRLTKCNNNKSNYLPHHGVLKLESDTTKLRVVFNASARTSTGKSLNDLMYRGPNLQKDLQSLILKWRTYKFVITADIEKMFRQFMVRKSDQSLQTIVWRNSQFEPLQEYQLTTVTYGTKAAPFLAMRTLKQLARDEALKYPLAAEAIECSFYTDDLLTGHNSVEAMIQLITELIHVFKSADMNLRKWSSNVSDILTGTFPQQAFLSNSNFEFKCQETRKTLGLKWSPNTDTFTFSNHFEQINYKQVLTKRQLLSEISKIFDPLGWLSPLSVRAKLIFQGTWSAEMGWDSNISTEIQERWTRLKDDFKDLENIHIPRYVGQSDNKHMLHAFCDASDKAYACALYLVTINNKGECTSELIAAKTKLSPLSKKISLPRLELCGAVLLSKLLKKVVEVFCHLNLNVYAWTDSMIVLGWLHGDCARWKSFVANRVQQISNIIPASNWHHVRSEDNPADCATRGLTKQRLSEYTLWWKGPHWILSFDSNKFNNKVYEAPTIEIKNTIVYATLKDTSISLISELLHQYNSLTRVTKVLGWVLRFITCVRNKQTYVTSYLSTGELNNALNYIVKSTQEDEFNDDIRNIRQKGFVNTKSKIINLNPFLDDQGILRVRGRLSNSSLNYSAKHPIILSPRSRLTYLIISEAHLLTLHGGPRLTLSYIRNRFWIISGIRTVKNNLRQCVRCRRYASETRNHIMGDLPQPRVTPSRPFTHTGVDFTGFVDLRINKGRGVKTCKGYIAVFVCLATKATHLELVSDLSTTTFLAAFKRFCARRGTPSHMYSDNGTNFIGADRLIKREYQEIVQNINTEFFNNINTYQIEWHFNAPAWPTAGGLWEAAVKSMKFHLKRVLGDQKLTYEEFSTLLHQIEACLNSRPLCQLTESIDDEFLTPGHFLVGGPLLSRPQTEPTTATLVNRWQLVQSMNKHFWKRWSAEYLQQLQIRTKWRTQNKNLNVNDIVLIKEDNLPPGKWAMARVQELHPGADGFVRVVTLKTHQNTVKRPINKLVVLPVREEIPEQPLSPELSPKSSVTEAQTKNEPPRPSPRRSKRLLSNVLLSILLLFTICCSPTYQQPWEQRNFNITTLDSNRGLFFDRISDLKHIKDDWKLIVYYNMTTYWQGVNNIKNYISYIRKSCKECNPQYHNIILQLEQDAREIDYFNDILINNTRSVTKRHKRGLVNGIGYIANTLFGVLDERFANQYKDDIEKITINYNHLQALFKNQTSVVESEYNILKRNEEVMNQQFKFINEHLQNTSTALNHVILDTEHGFSIISSALTANIILGNLRRMQQTIIDTITDITQGHINPHLILPQELQKQLNIISSELRGDLTLPIDTRDIKDIYKLIKIFTRIVDKYLIIEIKIPLLSADVFELNKIVTVPLIRGSKSHRLIPTFPYLAYNLNKDHAFLLTEHDLQSCLHISENNIILCSLNMPLYQLKLKQSLCDIKLLSADSGTRACTTTITNCEDNWIKLHNNNEWLFACCEECHVRIYCTPVMTVKDMKGIGIISIGQGCTLRADLFSLYAHNNYISRTNIQHVIEVPGVSILNTLINTSLPNTSLEYHEHGPKIWNELRDQIDNIKRQSATEFSVHDVHHYTVTYIIIFTILIVGVGVVVIRRRRAMRAPRASEQTSAGVGQEEIQLRELSVPSDMGNFSEVKVSVRDTNESSVLSVHKGTSPVPIRSRLP